MKRGFMYLTAIIDVYSCKIVGWGISNSMSAQWCKRVLEEAIEEYGKPEIVNSDQGTQYTSALWTQYLGNQGIRISMDGKGRGHTITIKHTIPPSNHSITGMLNQQKTQSET